jgi:hypothetical protein
MKRRTRLLILLGCLAFFKYEQPAGLNKICFYDHLGSDVAITISAVELCPLSLRVPH